MKKAGALASALRSSGAAVAASAPPEPDETINPSPASEPDRQPSRLGTKAITVHFPEEVRRHLKAMAGEQGRDVADMVAEGLNLLFAKYRKAELAPRKASK
jgi:hypothetical protein